MIMSGVFNWRVIARRGLINGANFLSTNPISMRSMNFPSSKNYLFTWSKNVFWKNFIRSYNVVEPGVVSSVMRQVPPHIPRPPYSETGIPPPAPEEIQVNDATAIKGMRKSCRLARHILDKIGKEVQVGKTTDDLDAIVHHLAIAAGAYPSPLNYKGFPKSVCTSVNNVCCHGIPDDRPLQDGDIVNVDITVYFEGYHGDCSQTFLVGSVDDAGRELVRVSELCLEEGISVCKPGVSFSEIGAAIEDAANKNGFTVLPAFAGHGIGSYFHGPPEIVHVRNTYPAVMESGNIFTIEPALSHGGKLVEILDDGWTCVTADEARSAQSEHTVLITDSGVEVLTVS